MKPQFLLHLTRGFFAATCVAGAVGLSCGLAVAGDQQRTDAAVGLTIAATLAACTLLSLVARQVVRQKFDKDLQRILDALAEMSIGECDLTRRLQVPRRDELGAVGMYFDVFVGRVQETLASAVALGSEADEAADTIAGASQTLARSAEASASTIDGIVTRLGEIHETSCKAAAACQEASSGADRARDAVSRGNGDVDRLTTAMDEISESSQTITKVVGVIQDVSFQTNLLALNAAVEAARAGEAGKGFAVVAEEVRSLARRSAEAAMETSALIEEACRRAQRGGAIAEEVAMVLGQIHTETNQVGKLLDDAVEQVVSQNESVGEITGGIDTLNRSTQANAASARELAVTSQRSLQQIKELQRSIGVFRVQT